MKIQLKKQTEIVFHCLQHSTGTFFCQQISMIQDQPTTLPCKKCAHM